MSYGCKEKLNLEFKEYAVNVKFHHLYHCVNKAIISCTSCQCRGHTYKHAIISQDYCKTQGHALAQLVEALRYKSEGRVFDSR